MVMTLPLTPEQSRQIATGFVLEHVDDAFWRPQFGLRVRGWNWAGPAFDLWITCHLELEIGKGLIPHAPCMNISSYVQRILNFYPEHSPRNQQIGRERWSSMSLTRLTSIIYDDYIQLLNIMLSVS